MGAARPTARTAMSSMRTPVARATICRAVDSASLMVRPCAGPVISRMWTVHQPPSLVMSISKLDPQRYRRKGAMVASQNVEIAKKAYEAYGAGDVETALADFDDNIEWSIPGNSAISGDYRCKDQFMELRGAGRDDVVDLKRDIIVLSDSAPACARHRCRRC